MADTGALHKFVFRDEQEELARVVKELQPEDLNHLYRGHTPLTLAVCLNRKECVKILLEAGASSLSRTADGWTPYQEATSIGDRQVMKEVFMHRRQEIGRWFHKQGKELLTTLSQDVQDFYLEMHWQFQSWIPFVSQICPSDTHKVYKKGTSVRIDTTLVGFERMSWLRGNISIVFTQTATGPNLVIYDEQRRLVQQVYPRDFTLSDQDVEEEISVSLNTNIMATPEIDFQSFNMSRAQNGFWSFKVDRNEKVGPWDTQVWNVECLEFVNRVRYEHLEVEPLPAGKKREKLQAAKAEPVKSTSGFVVVNADADDEQWASEAAEAAAKEPEGDDWSQAKRHFRELASFRPSLEAPKNSNLNFDEFFEEGCEDKFVCVGRERLEKSTSKAFKGTVWMYNGGATVADGAKGTSSVLDWISSTPSPNLQPGPPPIQSNAFPIRLSTLIPLLDLMGMSSNQHVRSLREFFNVQLPPGFPVKVEIPLNMIPLSVVLTFQNIDTNREMDDSLFQIPGKKEGYREGEVHDFFSDLDIPCLTLSK
ncbi:hypothetical protein HDU67_005615 [Dinochytrium kinnereticum]|nr:hypothetical protein HDU67_005615 [Dinochytrium kinnereticum]